MIQRASEELGDRMSTDKGGEARGRERYLLTPRSAALTD